MVLSSYKLVLPSGFGEIMASKLAKVPGQSSAKGLVSQPVSLSGGLSNGDKHFKVLV